MAEIIRCYKLYGGQKPPKLNHDGIDHVFSGKGSTILYFQDGEWLKLTGAD
jgi:hypothetical protein